MASAVLHDQWAVRLACQLVLTHHGPISEKLCRHLAIHGVQSLSDILRASGMPTSQVKQALLLLIQHNYVSAYSITDEDARIPKPPTLVYQVNLENVMQILRHPRFLLHARQEAGEEAERLVMQLLINGRLTYHQLVKALAVQQGKPEAQMREPVRNTLMALVNFHYVERAPPCGLPPPTVLAHPDSLKKRRSAKAGDQAGALRGLEELKHDKLRFQVPTDLIMVAAEETAVKGEGAEGKKEEEFSDEEGTTQGGAGSKRRRGAALPTAKKRIKAGTKREDAVATRDGAQAALLEQAATAAAANEQAQNGQQQVLWRVNPDEFNRRFRHQACVEMARDKFDADSAAVMEAMLATSRSYETKVAQDQSTNVTVDEVCAQLRRLATSRARAKAMDERGLARALRRDAARALAEAAIAEAAKAEAAKADAAAGDAEGEAAQAASVAGSTAGSVAKVAFVEEEENDEDELPAGEMDGEEAEELDELCSKVPGKIAELCADALGFVSYVGEGINGTIYAVNMYNFMCSIKIKTLEAVARDRFGQPGMRIFKMLMMKGQLEQKQVAEMAMLPIKDVRTSLYNMLQAGFVYMQDIPKTSDRAPSRTFYTWHTEWLITAERFASDLLRAAGNAWVRLQHEMSICRELLDLVEASQLSGTLSFNITAAQRGQLARLQKVSRQLNSALIDLDEQIALFCSY